MSKGDEDFNFHFQLKAFKLFDMFDCSSSSVRELHLHIGWLQLPEVVSGKSGKLAVAPEFTSATHSPHSVGKMGRGRVLKPQLSPWSSVVTQRAQHEGEQQGERQKEQFDENIFRQPLSFVRWRPSSQATSSEAQLPRWLDEEDKSKEPEVPASTSATVFRIGRLGSVALSSCPR